MKQDDASKVNHLCGDERLDKPKRVGERMHPSFKSRRRESAQEKRDGETCCAPGGNPCTYNIPSENCKAQTDHKAIANYGSQQKPSIEGQLHLETAEA